MKTTFLIIIVGLAIISSSCRKKTEGCTDPRASNYNPDFESTNNYMCSWWKITIDSIRIDNYPSNNWDVDSTSLPDINLTCIVPYNGYGGYANEQPASSLYEIKYDCQFGETWELLPKQDFFYRNSLPLWIRLDDVDSGGINNWDWMALIAVDPQYYDGNNMVYANNFEGFPESIQISKDGFDFTIWCSWSPE